VLSLDDIDFGFKFSQHLYELKANNAITAAEEQVVQEKCRTFILN